MLTAIFVRTVRVDKTKEFADEAGLVLRVSHTGVKTWRWAKKFNGVLHRQTIGQYPQLSLTEARRKAMQLSAELVSKPQEKAPVKKVTVAQAYEQWFEEKRVKVQHPLKIAERFRAHILPALGDCDVKSVNDKLLKEKLQYLEDEGKTPTLQRVIGSINELMRWCVSEGLIDRVCTEYAMSRFGPVKPVEHRKALDPDDLWQLFTVKDGNSVGNERLLLWSIYSMLRPNENVSIKLSWINFDKRLLVIPAEQMKMRREHVVPLTKQMLDLIDKQMAEAEGFGLQTDYLFWSVESKSGHVSRETLARGLRRTGMNDMASVHGLRASARTYLARVHVPETVAEACLAHTKGSAVKEAYDRERFIEERREVMQGWCNFIDLQLSSHGVIIG